MIERNVVDPGRGLRPLGVVVLAALALAGCEDAPEGTSSGGVEPADPAIERLLDKTLPQGAGGALIAAQDGRMVHCEGFGMADRETQTPAGCDTAFDIQSMTKQFTAAAILKLEMMGKLDASDPIAKHLGGVPADKRDITLHHLLTHTAGLPNALGGDYQPLTRRDLLAGALGSELRSRPGSEYRYSNVGYSVLGAIIEKASGLGYEEFLAEHLFEPAGMTDTGYVLPEWRPDQVAVEYNARGEAQGRPFEHPWASDGPYWNLRGNGGLLSTARDMFRWHRALEGDEVLDQRAKAKLFEPYVLEEPGGNTHYGYGWVIQRTGAYGPVAWHDGGNAWVFGVLTRLLDERVMVFWVTNGYRDKGEGWNLARFEPRLTRSVAKRVLGDD